MHLGRRSLLLSLLTLPLALPLALACSSRRHDGGTTSPSPGPASPERVDVSRIFSAELVEGRWQIQYAAPSLPENVRELLQDGLDGVNQTLDPALLGRSAPFTVGDELVIVTSEGALEARVESLGGWLGGGNDWLIAVLDVPGSSAAAVGPALAVLGPRPHAKARLTSIPPVPLGPRVGSALADGKAQLPKLLDQFAEWLGSGTKLDAAKLRVDTECARTFVPALPPGVEQLLVVHCNNEEEMQAPISVSSIVALGETPQVIHPWNLDAWSLELRGVVDLDGDGIDELWISASGHEWWSTSLYHWDGQRYVEEEISADAL